MSIKERVQQIIQQQETEKAAELRRREESPSYNGGYDSSNEGPG